MSGSGTDSFGQAIRSPTRYLGLGHAADWQFFDPDDDDLLTSQCPCASSDIQSTEASLVVADLGPVTDAGVSRSVRLWYTSGAADAAIMGRAIAALVLRMLRQREYKSQRR